MYMREGGKLLRQKVSYLARKPRVKRGSEQELHNLTVLFNWNYPVTRLPSAHTQLKPPHTHTTCILQCYVLIQQKVRKQHYFTLNHFIILYIHQPLSLPPSLSLPKELEEGSLPPLALNWLHMKECSYVIYLPLRERGTPDTSCIESASMIEHNKVYHGGLHMS